MTQKLSDCHYVHQIVKEKMSLLPIKRLQRQFIGPHCYCLQRPLEATLLLYSHQTGERLIFCKGLEKAVIKDAVTGDEALQPVDPHLHK